MPSDLVGMAGFEPAASSSRSQRATWPTTTLTQLTCLALRAAGLEVHELDTRIFVSGSGLEDAEPANWLPGHGRAFCMQLTRSIL
jgi:hypothetical protein